MHRFHTYANETPTKSHRSDRQSAAASVAIAARLLGSKSCASEGQVVITGTSATATKYTDVRPLPDSYGGVRLHPLQPALP